MPAAASNSRLRGRVSCMTEDPEDAIFCVRVEKADEDNAPADHKFNHAACQGGWWRLWGVLLLVGHGRQRIFLLKWWIYLLVVFVIFLQMLKYTSNKPPEKSLKMNMGAYLRHLSVLMRPMTQ